MLDTFTDEIYLTYIINNYYICVQKLRDRYGLPLLFGPCHYGTGTGSTFHMFSVITGYCFLYNLERDEKHLFIIFLCASCRIHAASTNLHQALGRHPSFPPRYGCLIFSLRKVSEPACGMLVFNSELCHGD